MREKRQQVERPQIRGVEILEDPDRRRSSRRPREGSDDTLPEPESVTLVVLLEALRDVDTERA